MNKNKTVVLVQARMGSARLPGKSMRIMCGYPMIRHVMKRASQIDVDAQTWLVTSLNERDDLLAAEVSALGFPVYRGSEWDVLQRMSEAALIARASTVVRITGDCPLLAPDVSANTLDIFRSGKYDYVSNDTSCSGWPDGMDTEVFHAELLHKAAGHAIDRQDREHVTRWMRRELLEHRKAIFMNGETGFQRIKLSVDSAEDFDRVAGVMFEAQGHVQWPATRDAYMVWAQKQTGGEQ